MIKYVDSRTLGLCPAAVYMETGDIEVNTSVWDTYTPFQQAFILYHELGHYRLRTDDETLADRYALHQLYARYPQSLKQSLGTLARLRIPDSRMEALYRECLLLDAEQNNNVRAQLELIKQVKTHGRASQPSKDVSRNVSSINQAETRGRASQQNKVKTMKPSKLKEVKINYADGTAVEEPTSEVVDTQEQKVDAIINKMYQREMSRGGDFGFERRLNFKHHLQTLLTLTVLLFCIAIWRKVKD